MSVFENSKTFEIRADMKGRDRETDAKTESLFAERVAFKKPIQRRCAVYYESLINHDIWTK